MAKHTITCGCGSMSFYVVNGDYGIDGIMCTLCHEYVDDATLREDRKALKEPKNSVGE